VKAKDQEQGVQIGGFEVARTYRKFGLPRRSNVHVHQAQEAVTRFCPSARPVVAARLGQSRTPTVKKKNGGDLFQRGLSQKSHGEFPSKEKTKRNFVDSSEIHLRGFIIRHKGFQGLYFQLIIIYKKLFGQIFFGTVICTQIFAP
jgi:hypothetical protein